MFSFFTDRKWMHWSILGSVFILVSTWLQVQLDVQINEWFGEFYDTMQKAVTEPGSVTLEEFINYLWVFAKIAGVWIAIMIVTGFFISHWLFRWRMSMIERYHKLWKHASHIEGASQRVQEDTVKFSRMMESLGVGFLDAIMTLLAFLPILYTLSKQVTELPWIGQVDHALIWVAILTALGGTLLLVGLGKILGLVGVEYDIQLEEAAYRKELVLGESSDYNMKQETVNELFFKVMKIHFKSYNRYFFFNTGKWSYLQFMVIVPYLALAPTIISGLVTFGFIQQITRAFGRVESSLQFLVRSWGTIIELMSVFKRLREFERQIEISILEDRKWRV